jgi:hypothetical protein
MSVSAIPISSVSMNSATATASDPLRSDIISAGPLSLYFHRTDDEDWVWPKSYKHCGTYATYTELFGVLKEIGNSEFIKGMYFLMKDPYPPVWEDKAHLHGGTYCINIKEVSAFETFQIYAGALGEGLATKTAANRIVGLSISPKKGFHIMKIWNTDAKYKNVEDVCLYTPDMKASDIRYRVNTDQRF